MFWGWLVRATSGSSSSAVGGLCRCICKTGMQCFYFAMCLGLLPPGRVLRRLGCSRPHGRCGQRPGGAEIHNSSTLQCSGAGFRRLPPRRVLRRLGGLHIHKSSTLQCFGAGSRRLPPSRVLRRMHGCRGPNLHTAVAVTDRGAQVGGTSRGRKSVAQVGGTSRGIAASRSSTSGGSMLHGRCGQRPEA